MSLNVYSYIFLLRHLLQAMYTHPVNNYELEPSACKIYAGLISLQVSSWSLSVYLKNVSNLLIKSHLPVTVAICKPNLKCVC